MSFAAIPSTSRERQALTDFETELSTRARQQEVLAELSQLALTGVEAQPLMDAVAVAVAQTLGVEYSSVLELLAGGNSLLLRAGVGWTEGTIGRATVSVGLDSQAGYTLHADSPVIVDDLRSETRFVRSRVLHEHHVISGISVPVHGNCSPFGVLSAHTSKQRTFGEYDVHFLLAVANVLALALQRTRADEAMRQHAARLATLEAIDRAILAAESPKEIALAAMTRLRRWVPYERASLVLFDFAQGIATAVAVDGDPELGPREGERLPLDQFSPQAILPQARVRHIEDLLSYPLRSPILEQLLATGIRSLITVYLITEGQLIGHLNISSTQARSFDAAHGAMLYEVANPLAIAIQQARLRAEAKQNEILRRTDELHQLLLNSISHDLRTPLVAIKAAAGSLLQADVAWNKRERDEFATIINAEVDRLNRLVSNVLDLSRIEAGALRPDKQLYPLIEVVQAVVERLAALTARHILVVAVPDDLPLVPLDVVEIDQVLSNLLENAVRHTPEGTEVRISAKVQMGELSACVSDRGPGIPVAERAQLFERFYRHAGRRPTGGSGLGLVVCKGLVEAHGGRIWLEDTPGGGATLSFTLPYPGERGA